MKPLHALRVKSEAESPKRTKLAQVMEARAAINTSGAKESLGLQVTKKKSMGKKSLVKNVKQNLPKVKCFNCDNNRHLAKDCPKPPWVSDYIAKGKLIFQGFKV